MRARPPAKLDWSPQPHVHLTDPTASRVDPYASAMYKRRIAHRPLDTLADWVADGADMGDVTIRFLIDQTLDAVECPATDDPDFDHRWCLSPEYLDDEGMAEFNATYDPEMRFP